MVIITCASDRMDVCMSNTNAGIAYMKAPYNTKELQTTKSMGFLANEALLTTKQAVKKAHQDVDDACRDLRRAKGTLEESSSICLFLEGQI